MLPATPLFGALTASVAWMDAVTAALGRLRQWGVAATLAVWPPESQQATWGRGTADEQAFRGQVHAAP